jgi:hypothetical protein
MREKSSDIRWLSEFLNITYTLNSCFGYHLSLS